VKRRLLIAVLLGSLFGCGSSGLVPGGTHFVAPGTLQAIVHQQSFANDVPERLVSAMISAESNGDPSAISRSGAQGLMQLMPGTAAQYGVGNPFDPWANVSGGTRYLHDLLARYRGNVTLAVAAYNAGPGAVDAAHGVPNFAETRAYVARVTAAFGGK
jgi:soluble lytic murein transglycosylase-like protein